MLKHLIAQGSWCKTLFLIKQNRLPVFQNTEKVEKDTSFNHTKCAIPWAEPLYRGKLNPQSWVEGNSIYFCLCWCEEKFQHTIEVESNFANFSYLLHEMGFTSKKKKKKMTVRLHFSTLCRCLKIIWGVGELPSACMYELFKNVYGGGATVPRSYTHKMASDTRPSLLRHK